MHYSKQVQYGQKTMSPNTYIAISIDFRQNRPWTSKFVNPLSYKTNWVHIYHHDIQPNQYKSEIWYKLWDNGTSKKTYIINSLWNMATFHNQYYSQLIVQSNFPQLLSKTISPPNKVWCNSFHRNVDIKSCQIFHFKLIVPLTVIFGILDLNK